ncbi:MAG: 2-phosphosulfolactate phosphatase [Fretibacterium sp.]|nr:2-phosphosulfolactate phosphatase [Fretibacterium sp.]
MTLPVEIEVVLSLGEPLPEVDVWLIIDILRATTVMVRWFELGGAELYPFDSVEGARAAASRLSSDGRAPLLMGERNAVAPPGFDLGNSPSALTSELVRRHPCAVMATTNGTRSLLTAAEEGVPVLAACARNAAAVLNAALARGCRLGLFCAGREGRPSWDDTLCAGMLVEALQSVLPVRLTDAARLALLVWNSSSELLASLLTADHARSLEALGFGADIAFAAQTDVARSVPELRETESSGVVLRDAFSSDTPCVVRVREGV